MKPVEVKNEGDCRVAVIWIDWYPYHVARLRGLLSDSRLHGHVTGIELVGGVGVHEGLKFREEMPEGVHVETLMPDQSWKSADKWKLSLALWHKLNQLKPDVVLVPGYYTLPGLTGALWARLHRKGSVLMTESTAADHARLPLKEWLKSAMLWSLFDWAVAGGKRHLEYLRQLGFPEHRVKGCYDVVGNNEIFEATQALRALERKPIGMPKDYFLFIGRFAPEKNLVFLVLAWLRYRAQGGTWPLVLVGDGPMYPDVTALAAGSPYSSDMYFPGQRSSKELYPYLAFAGCFVLPSIREPWGLVVNEALASGLPVLVSDRCGAAADLVIEGQNGFTFDPHSLTQLTNLMTEMEGLPPSQRDSYADTSIEVIRQYSPERFGHEIGSIWSAVKQGSTGANASSAVAAL